MKVHLVIDSAMDSNELFVEDILNSLDNVNISKSKDLDSTVKWARENPGWDPDVVIYITGDSQVIFKSLRELKIAWKESRIICVADQFDVLQLVALGIYDLWFTQNEYTKEDIIEWLNTQKTIAEAVQLSGQFRRKTICGKDEEKERAQWVEKVKNITRDISLLSPINPIRAEEPRPVASNVSFPSSEFGKLNILVIVSPGPEIAKTAGIALNTCRFLIQQGFKAALIDADFEQSEVAKYLEIPETDYWQIDWRRSGASAGFKLENIMCWILNPRDNRQDISKLKEVLLAINQLMDRGWVVWNFGCGYNSYLANTVYANASAVWVVTTPEISQIPNSQYQIKQFNVNNARLLVDMVSKDKEHIVDWISSRFKLPLAGALPIKEREWKAQLKSLVIDLTAKDRGF